MGYFRNLVSGWQHRRGRRRFYIARGICVGYISIFAQAPAPLAQPSSLACTYYGERCGDRIASPLCVQLQQRCQAATGEIKPDRPRAGTQPASRALGNLQQMPDCGPDEELVMLPTCMCNGTADQEAETDAKAGCASCSSDGVRLGCQKRD